MSKRALPRVVARGFQWRQVGFIWRLLRRSIRSKLRRPMRRAVQLIPALGRLGYRRRREVQLAPRVQVGLSRSRRQVASTHAFASAAVWIELYRRDDVTGTHRVERNPSVVARSSSPCLQAPDVCIRVGSHNGIRAKVVSCRPDAPTTTLRRRDGHGTAVAPGASHAVLPMAAAANDERDRVTARAPTGGGLAHSLGDCGSAPTLADAHPGYDADDDGGSNHDSNRYPCLFPRAHATTLDRLGGRARRACRGDIRRGDAAHGIALDDGTGPTALTAAASQGTRARDLVAGAFGCGLRDEAAEDGGRGL